MDALTEVERLEHRTLGERAYNQLADLLTSGRVSPGDKLTLRAVADAFGVSIQPIREAVSRLVSDGALEATANRAVRVPTMTLAQFRDLTKVRLMVEGQAAAEAALTRTEADLEAMRVAEAGFREQGEQAQPDVGQAVRFNKEFHFAVYGAAHSPLLVNIIRGLWLKAGPIINLDSRENPNRIATGGLKRHIVILEAIERGDAEAARAALAADINVTADVILARSTFARPE
ncbi:GntR family transcriptional regulator [Bosea lathyri]|jgi:DNA-binding GntR family transcriptional regulator|uniref:Transcriptional regulator, GntR family n=1 Tax=Bosea lathyri TaxID=1036778 RepID=A0A1H6D869_9HYPH|nr:GntR family transcriptional regulator [Bosea lathyri]SEG81452.1 transcriptional regulator, GntR family [Bosea lathyri]